MTTRVPPNEQRAERDLLGSVLTVAVYADEVNLSVGDFYWPKHQTIWGAIRRLRARKEPVDLTTVEAECNRETETDKVNVSRADLLDLVADSLHLHPQAYEDLIRRAAIARRAIVLAEDLSEAAWGADLDAVAGLLTEQGDRLLAPLDHVQGDEMDDLLADETPEIEKPWIVPGTFRRREVLVVTGAEGWGKTTLMRQSAMCCASGIHPFTGIQLEMPVTPVLHVDLQEDRLDSRDAYRPLRRAAGTAYEPGMLHVANRPHGMNLLDATDRRWLESLISHHQPGLVVMGPVRKLYRQTGRYGKGTEEAVDELTRIIDDLRIGYGFGLILEAHAGHDREDWRVRGSSVWFDWPDFGFGLAPVCEDPREVDTRRWRADRHVGRAWPTNLRAGTRWPWEPDQRSYERIIRGMGLDYLLDGGDQQFGT